MSQLLEELEWLGSHLDPLEQTIILNNLDKLIKDQSNLMERIKRGERPADIFASPPLDGSENPHAVTEGAPRRRRRVSAGSAAGPPSKKAVALTTSESVPESDSPGNGVVPGNPRKRCGDAEGEELFLYSNCPGVLSVDFIVQLILVFETKVFADSQD